MVIPIVVNLLVVVLPENTLPTVAIRAASKSIVTVAQLLILVAIAINSNITPPTISITIDVIGHLGHIIIILPVSGFNLRNKLGFDTLNIFDCAFCVNVI